MKSENKNANESVSLDIIYTSDRETFIKLMYNNNHRTNQ